MSRKRWPPLPRDPQLEIRRSNIPNLAAGNVQGHADGMGTSFQGLWGDSAVPDITALYDTPATVKVASTSAEDATGQTGATDILLSGYSSTNVAQSETIDMNGQSEVTSSLTYKSVTGLTSVGATVGSVKKNVGNIWAGNGSFTSGVPATKYAFSEAGDTVMKSGIDFVATGHIKWVIQLIFLIADTSKSLDIHLITYDGQIERLAAPFEVGAGTFVATGVAVPALVAGTLFWLEGKVGASTADISTIIAFDDETL